MTKLVCSRWRDFGQVLGFFCFWKFGSCFSCLWIDETNYMANKVTNQINHCGIAGKSWANPSGQDGCSDSQSQRRIYSILPARRASSVIKVLTAVMSLLSYGSLCALQAINLHPSDINGKVSGYSCCSEQIFFTIHSSYYL